MFDAWCIMLARLSALEPAILARVCHVHFLADMIITARDDGDRAWHVASALALLSSLRLSTLTIRALDEPRVGHEALDGLVREGRGWRELRYVSLAFEMPGFARFDPCVGGEAERQRFWRRPQPAHWQGASWRRGTARAKGGCPSVTIFRSTAHKCFDSAHDPRTSTCVEQEEPEDEDCPARIASNQGSPGRPCEARRLPVRRARRRAHNGISAVPSSPYSRARVSAEWMGPVTSFSLRSGGPG